MTRETLILTEEDKNSGIVNVTREGNLKTGFQIGFQIKELILTLPVRPRDKVESIFSRFKKRLMEQPLDITPKEFSELCNTLESAIIRHIDWIVGEDIRRKKEGYATINSDNTLVSTNSEDTSDDSDYSTYKKVSVSDAIGMHQWKIQFEGIIAFTATDKMQFLQKAIWQCNNCGDLTTRRIFNILDIPNNPVECRSCETKAGFAHCHEYINSRLLKIQSEDNTNDTALELLPVYVLDKYTDNIQLSGRVRIYGKIAKRQIRIVNNSIL